MSALEINYVAPPTAAKFHQSEAFVRGIMGPIGCVRGDTKVYTEKGLVAIRDLDSSTRVLSWNDQKGRFQLSLSGGSFPKGKDYLYRVVTQSGEFVASGHHLTLCADGTYQRVDTLVQGQTLYRGSDTRLETNSESYPLTSLLSVQNYSQKDEDSLESYAKLARLCGQRLLQEEGIDLKTAPSLDDVQTLLLNLDPSSFGHRGDLLAQLQERIRHGQCDDLLCIDDFLPRLEHQCADAEGHDEGISFSPLTRTAQLSEQSPRKIDCHQHTAELSVDSCSFSNSLSNETILDVERLDVNEVYWDMQVLDTNNYVTEGGFIHHNSGKSVSCCMEIFRRAQEQKKAPDGFRKSRWLVVRNTLPQLETTTIKTWVDWFPPATFGRMTGKPPYTHRVEFGDVKMEVIFIALDKPEDVKKLLSFECTGIWFNEAREIRKEIIDAGTGRVGRFPSAKDGGCTWSGIIMDTNPPDDSHWWYRLSQEESPEGWEFFQQPSGLSDEGENLEHHMQPSSEHLSKEEKEIVTRPDARKSNLTLYERKQLGKRYYKRMIGGKTKEWINVYVHGNFGFLMNGKPVFQGSWNDDLHTSKEEIKLNPDGDMIAGIDCSGRNPAVVFIQKTALGQYQAIDELVVEDIGAVAFSRLLETEVKRRFPHNRIAFYGDPAGTYKATTDERTYVDILRGHGIIVYPASTNKIHERLQSVEGPLLRLVEGKPALIVDKKCKILRRGFNGGYKFKQLNVSGGERFQDDPEKNRFSDVQDALQYAMLGAGEGGQMRQRKSAFKGGRQLKAKSDFSL